MKNLPANPLLHTLIFFLITAQFGIGQQLCHAEAQCDQRWLWLHLFVGPVIALLYVIWIKKLGLSSRLKQVFTTPRTVFGDEIKTLLCRLWKLKNPGADYPALAGLTQLLGLGAVGLTLLTGLLHGFVLTQTSLKTKFFYEAHEAGIALIVIFLVGHIGMAFLHKLEKR